MQTGEILPGGGKRKYKGAESEAYWPFREAVRNLVCLAYNGQRESGRSGQRGSRNQIL